MRAHVFVSGRAQIHGCARNCLAHAPLCLLPHLIRRMDESSGSRDLVLSFGTIPIHVTSINDLKQRNHRR